MLVDDVVDLSFVRMLCALWVSNSDSVLGRELCIYKNAVDINCEVSIADNMVEQKNYRINEKYFGLATRKSILFRKYLQYTLNVS